MNQPMTADGAARWQNRERELRRCPSRPRRASVSGALFVFGAAIAVRMWVAGAAERLTTPEAEQPKVADR